ncbi:MAG TPA: class II glutamine amidotransferase, partial [Chloroflexota bacterium]|nr:class II glutamine amidotransferase [Chloroflexota bacterium]
MCGVAGFLYKDPGRTGPIGQTVLRMLDVLGSRGVDGTGVALYGAGVGRSSREKDTASLPTPDSRLPTPFVVRVVLGGYGPAREQAARITDRVERIATVQEAKVQHDYLRLVISDSDDPSALADAVEHGDPGIEVFSIGRAMEVVKQVGPARVLHETYCLATFQGTHGIGHTRLATESRVDISHCHPFWARPHADIAVVHNGQITNYRKLRRRMEMRGVHFCTDNDSEIIALYIAEQLASGATLQQALERSVDDLDGTFTYLISTAQGIGMARDCFDTKPLVVAETD